jgi:ABC-type transporter Mla subunit MlaD
MANDIDDAIASLEQAVASLERANETVERILAALAKLKKALRHQALDQLARESQELGLYDCGE